MSLTLPQRLGMLAANGWSFVHLLATGALALAPWATWGWRGSVAVLWFYLAPPLLARVVRGLWTIPEGRIAHGSRAFFGWWMLFNLQTVFCRFPASEEMLRLVPGLYSGWLRLWGAQIGRLTYWAPGTLILDRSFLRIGNDVVFGAGVRLNPHVMAKNRDGDLELVLATIVIGDRTVVGGYSLLTAGTEIAADECTRAFTISPPFSKWRDGRRTGKPDAEA